MRVGGGCDERMSSETGVPLFRRAPLARASGAVLDRVFAAVQRLRHSRPIHDRGVVLSGILRRIPDAAPSGIRFIDDPAQGPVPVVARVSRSLGLPAPLPDVIGLALRLDIGGTACDLELASTGWRVPGRFALLPRRRPERAHFGSLLPSRGRRGPVVLMARTRSGRAPATDPRELRRDDDAVWSLVLAHATPAGRWHPFALVDLRADPDQDDSGLRFDTVRRPLPGARTYPWVGALRQPSYLRVQPQDGGLRMP